MRGVGQLKARSRQSGGQACDITPSVINLKLTASIKPRLLLALLNRMTSLGLVIASGLLQPRRFALTTFLLHSALTTGPQALMDAS